jgi:hypothetical protein
LFQVIPVSDAEIAGVLGEDIVDSEIEAVT